MDLNQQLIKLGDMMGDGLHHEPDGKWIEQDYRRVAKALGYKFPRKNNASVINEHMARRVKGVSCGKCGGDLKQTRAGSKRATCANGHKWQLLK